MIEGHNRDDVLSTLRLRDWLEERRTELAETIGGEVPRPVYEEKERTEEAKEKAARVTAAFDRLMEGVPAEEADRSDEQHARWVLAHLLEWHRREEKSFWWNYFNLRDMTPEELVHERTALGALGPPEFMRVEKLSNVGSVTLPPGVDAGQRLAPK